MQKRTLDMWLDKALGDIVRARRLNLNMSQKELAALVGVSFQQIQKYEKGQNRISPAALVAIGEAIKCPAENLLKAARLQTR